ncbi:MAG: dTMP kinase [Simkaniaceae bacterium]|nr:dTMP kinase [Simkaniaceae bacterium]
MKRRNKGLFVTFEGGEGAGKTTLIQRVYAALSDRGCRVIKTLEPGGTPLGREIRTLLLHAQTISMCASAELFLFLADRAHHVKTVILPALEEGKVVLCDRFNDSTLAYQGAARHLDIKLLRSFCSVATSGLTPDLTFYLDLDPKVGLERARKKDIPDRLEKENIAFHTEVRQGFLSLAKQEPERFYVINGEKGIEDVYQKAMTEIESLLCLT